MKAYAKLRGALAEIDMGQRELAIRLGKSKTYVMERMTAKKPWDLTDCYAIIDLVKVPNDQMFELFPRNGGIPYQAERRKKCG